MSLAEMLKKHPVPKEAISEIQSLHYANYKQENYQTCIALEGLIAIIEHQHESAKKQETYAQERRDYIAKLETVDVQKEAPEEVEGIKP